MSARKTKKTGQRRSARATSNRIAADLASYHYSEFTSQRIDISTRSMPPGSELRAVLTIDARGDGEIRISTKTLGFAVEGDVLVLRSARAFYVGELSQLLDRAADRLYEMTPASAIETPPSGPARRGGR